MQRVDWQVEVTEKNRRHCERCYCYVCDCRASECREWTRGGGSDSWAHAHCNAHAGQDLWKDLRAVCRDRWPPTRALWYLDSSCSWGSSGGGRGGEGIRQRNGRPCLAAASDIRSMVDGYQRVS